MNGDLRLEYLRCDLVGDEQHYDVGLGHSLLDAQHGETVLARLHRVLVVPVADENVLAAVPQVQRLSATLVAIADHCDCPALEES